MTEESKVHPLFRLLPLRLRFYLSIGIFGAGSLLFSTVCWARSWFPHGDDTHRRVRTLIYRLMRLWAWYTDACGVTDVRCQDAVKLRELKGAVLVANHPNLLDICWVLAAAPHAICLFKSGIKRNRFLSASVNLAGYISNDEGIRGVRRAIDAVKGGALLIVFPEGTRTRIPPLNAPLRPGFALIAKEAGVPVQTLFIHSDTQLFTKGSFFRYGPLPMRFRLGLGPAVYPDPRVPARRFADEVERVLRSGLEPGSGQS